MLDLDSRFRIAGFCICQSVVIPVIVILEVVIVVVVVVVVVAAAIKMLIVNATHIYTRH